MDSTADTDARVLWSYDQRLIRWVELSDEFGPEFEVDWFERARSSMEPHHVAPAFALAPPDAVISMSQQLGVGLRKWLDEIGIHLIVDHRLVLTPDVMRVGILDDDYAMGVLVTWVRRPGNPGWLPATSAFDVLASDDDPILAANDAPPHT